MVRIFQPAALTHSYTSRWHSFPKNCESRQVFECSHYVHIVSMDLDPFTLTFHGSGWPWAPWKNFHVSESEFKLIEINSLGPETARTEPTSFLLLVVMASTKERWHPPNSFLCLVYSYLLLVRPGAPSSVLVPSMKARRRPQHGHHGPSPPSATRIRKRPGLGRHGDAESNDVLDGLDGFVVS